MPISAWFWLLIGASVLASVKDISPSAAIFSAAAALIGYWHTRR